MYLRHDTNAASSRIIHQYCTKMSLIRDTSWYDMGMPTVGPKEFDLLAELNRRHKRTIALPQDSGLVSRYSTNPRLLVSRMAKKGLLRPISHGRYFVVGPGGGSLAQEASPYV